MRIFRWKSIKIMIIMMFIFIVVAMIIYFYDKVSYMDRPGYASPPHEVAKIRLRSLNYVQPTYKQGRGSDRDKDNIGEYGTLYELMLKRSFEFARQYYGPVYPLYPDNELTFGSSAESTSSNPLGYIYKIYIPLNPDDAEKYWCAYAWPAKKFSKEFVTYFVNEKGHIYYVNTKKHEGLGNGPKVGDAYKGEPFKSEVDTTKWKLVEPIH